MITITPEVVAVLMIASTVREARTSPDPQRCIGAMTSDIKVIGQAGPIRAAATVGAVIVEIIDTAAAEAGLDPDDLWQRVTSTILWRDDG